jgi:hypothetical protein
MASTPTDRRLETMQSPVARRIPSRERQLPPPCLTTGAYVTDETHLFRCISVDHSVNPDATALLEDCATLEVLILPLTELAAAHLRAVRAGWPEDAEAAHPAEVAV